VEVERVHGVFLTESLRRGDGSEGTDAGAILGSLDFQDTTALP